MNQETQILSHLLNNPENYYLYNYLLYEDIFNDPFHRSVYKVFIDLLNKNKKPDITSITKKLKGKYPNCLTNLVALYKETDYSFDFENTLYELLQEGKRQKLLSPLAFDIQRMVKEEMPIDYIQDKISKVMLKLIDKKPINLHDISTNIKNLLVAIKEKKFTGIKTGFKKFDKISCGLQKGDLIVVAGEPSQGKTALAMTIGRHVAENNKRVVFFSLEMSKEQLTARYISQKIGIYTQKLLEGDLTLGDKEIIDNIKPSEFYINEQNVIDLIQIVNLIKIYKIQKDIDIFIIDYLQLIINKEKGLTSEERVGMAARTFKNLARELNVNIILISQLSRDKINPEPRISRLRQSGQIEEAADIVLLVYRPEYYKIKEFKDGAPTEGKAEIIIGKGRNIGIGKFRVDFIKYRTLFKDEDDSELNLVEEEKDDSVPF